MIQSRRSIVAFGLVLVPLCFARTASASDWYVDALAGNDAAAGTSPATPWKTITHALATLSSGSGVDTVHVAAGQYSVLNGEVFPLVLRDQEQIVGDAGADSTIVVAHGTGATGFSIAADHEHNTAGVASATTLSGLSIQGFGVGIDVVARTNACDPTLHDVVLNACGIGIRVVIQPYSATNSPSASPALARERFTRNGTGLLVTSAASYAAPSAGRVTLADSLFSENYNGAVLDGFGRSPTIEIDRSRFLAQAAFGLRASGSIPPLENGTTVVVRDCLFARNVDGGAFIDQAFVGAARITGCTVTDTEGFGLRVLAPDTRIANTIAWGNSPDVQLLEDADVSHCDIGDPSFAGVQGSIDADPLFMDAVHGDYRLRFGSPCVDRAGDTASSLHDIAGNTRRIDGDLDTIAAGDIGAFELLPLALVGEPAIGHTIGIAFLGAEGASSTLFVAHSPLVLPSATPFGLSWLPLQGTVQSAVVHVHAGPPYVLRRRIPNDPALVGTTFSFQALTNSASAPAGAALSNPVTFVILP